MNKKYINIALASVLFCAVQNSNAMQGGHDRGSHRRRKLDTSSSQSPSLPKFYSTLLKTGLIKGVTEGAKKFTGKSDKKWVPWLVGIADDAAEINLASQSLKRTKFNQESIDNFITGNPNHGNSESLLGALLVAIGGRVASKLGFNCDKLFEKRSEGTKYLVHKAKRVLQGIFANKISKKLFGQQ